MPELNKLTGYALTGLTTNDRGELTDPRINTRSPLLTGQATLEGFLASLSGMDVVEHRSRELAGDEPCRAVVHHGGPGGIPGVLMIRPVSLPSWHRVGDVLDLATEAGVPSSVATRLELLPTGLWPYSSQFMDADTGRDLEAGASAWARASTSAAVLDLDDQSRNMMAAATTGFATAGEATRRVVPSVPSAVRALIRWGGLFTDPAVVAQLRPALYTWWA